MFCPLKLRSNLPQLCINFLNFANGLMLSYIHCHNIFQIIIFFKFPPPPLPPQKVIFGGDYSFNRRWTDTAELFVLFCFVLFFVVVVFVFLFMDLFLIIRRHRRREEGKDMGRVCGRWQYCEYLLGRVNEQLRSQ